MLTFKTKIIAVGLGSFLIFSGCAFGPSYQQPQVSEPSKLTGRDEDSKKSEAKDTTSKPSDSKEKKTGESSTKKAKPQSEQEKADSLASTKWWNSFQDGTLTQLIAEALKKGLDIRTAKARIDAARARSRAADWALAPVLQASAGAGVGQGSLGAPTFFPPFDKQGKYTAGISVSWELDLWGKFRKAAAAADANLQQNEELLRGVYVTLVADVAGAYFDLRALDLQVEAAEAAVQIRGDTWKFFSSRLEGGVSNELEVKRAEALLRDAEAQLADLQRAVVETENLLSILLARAPGTIARPSHNRLADAPPAVPSGLPAELLKRRPDVRAAAQALRFATERVGSRMGDLFPKLTLTGDLGMVSNDITKLGNSTNTSEVYNAGANLVWTAPILGGTRIAANVDQAEANMKRLEAEYEKTALNAFGEVSNALIAIVRLRDARKARELQVEALKLSEQIAQDRYKGGVSNFLDVLTTQDQLMIAELALADVQGKQLIALAQLYRALGGGWSVIEANSNQ